MRTSPPDLLEPLWQGIPVFDPEGLCDAATLALPSRHRAVGEARQFSGDVLRRWSLEAGLDEVALVVSELVTNAIRYGTRGVLPADVPTGEPPVRLHLLCWRDRLVCAVGDPSPAPPEAVARHDEDLGFAFDLDLAAESGRGLHLVDAFSDCWGWHPLTAAHPATDGGWATRGKIVWALFRLCRT